MRNKSNDHSYSRNTTILATVISTTLLCVAGSGHGDEGTPDPRETDYDLSWHTIDGGGAMFSTGGEYELSGTIGQPDASGPIASGEYELTGGFWFPLAPTDCNSDGVVDLFDYGDGEPCLSGPDGGLLFPDCNCFDVDGDSDVDLSDVARLQAEFTGG